MSAIALHVANEGVVVASDTYSIRPDTGEAVKFTDKFIPVQHLEMIVTGTGYHGFLLEWYWTLMMEAAAVDIATLDEFAPGLLKRTWERFRMKNNVLPADEAPGTGGVTITHVGYSSEKSTYMGRIYASANDFAPRPIKPHRNYFMPDLEGVKSSFDKALKLEDQIIRFFQKAKKLDEERPVGKQLGIGGEIKLGFIRADGYSCETIHRFDDYEETRDRILTQDTEDGLPTRAN